MCSVKLPRNCKSCDQAGYGIHGICWACHAPKPARQSSGQDLDNRLHHYMTGVLATARRRDFLRRKRNWPLVRRYLIARFDGTYIQQRGRCLCGQQLGGKFQLETGADARAARLRCLSCGGTAVEEWLTNYRGRYLGGEHFAEN